MQRRLLGRGLYRANLAPHTFPTQAEPAKLRTHYPGVRIMLARKLLLVIMLTMATVAGLAQAQSCTQLLASGNPEYPPFLWRDPQNDTGLQGANGELMQWLGREIGIPIETRYVGSWARVQEEMRHGKLDLIAGAFFTVARLDYMDYFHPPFQAARTVIWTRASHSFAFKQWSDLKGRQGLTVINNSFGEEFDRYAKNELTIHTVPSLEQALRMLAAGRMDYLIYEEHPAQAFAARLGINGLKGSANAVSNENLYLTLSHKSACNTPEVRAKLARAMVKLQKDGGMKAMLDNALRDWRRLGAAAPRS